MLEKTEAPSNAASVRLPTSGYVLLILLVGMGLMGAIVPVAAVNRSVRKQPPPTEFYRGSRELLAACLGELFFDGSDNDDICFAHFHQTKDSDGNRHVYAVAFIYHTHSEAFSQWRRYLRELNIKRAQRASGADDCYCEVKASWATQQLPALNAPQWWKPPSEPQEATVLDLMKWDEANQPKAERFLLIDDSDNIAVWLHWWEEDKELWARGEGNTPAQDREKMAKSPSYD